MPTLSSQPAKPAAHMVLELLQWQPPELLCCYYVCQLPLGLTSGRTAKALGTIVTSTMVAADPWYLVGQLSFRAQSCGSTIAQKAMAGSGFWSCCPTLLDPGQRSL